MHMKKKQHAVKLKTLKTFLLLHYGVKCLPCCLKLAILGSPLKILAIYVHHNNMLVWFTALILCTEITLNTSADEIAVCNLGSINLIAHMTENGIG